MDNFPSSESDKISFSPSLFRCDRMWPFAMVPIRQSLYQVGLFLVLSVLSISILQARQNISSDHDSETASAAGRTTFNSSCAGCHGLDGTGSDKAVNISGTTRARQLSDAQLSGIISNGIPGTGMPAFRSLNARQVRAIVDYLRSLQGKAEGRTLTGRRETRKRNFLRQGRLFRLPHHFRPGRIPGSRPHGARSYFIRGRNSR